MDRPTSVRIDPITEPEGELAEILEKTLLRDGKPLNIFGVLGHQPKLLKRFNLFAGYMLNQGDVPPRQKEIVILRVGWNARSVYEFGQHTVIGKQRGLTDAEVTALTLDPDDHEWSVEDRALIDLADDLCRDDCVSDDTWARLTTTWDSSALVELLVLAGTYRLVSGFLNSAGVELDEGVPGWPRAIE